MADSPLPPLTPPGGTPPPPSPVTPTSPLPAPEPIIVDAPTDSPLNEPFTDDDSAAQAAEALSPMSLLNKRPGTPPPPVPPVSPVAPPQNIPVPPPLPRTGMPGAAPIVSPVTPLPLPATPPAPIAVPLTVPKVPASGSPLDDDPDTDALVKQAASASQQPLILPNRQATSSLPPQVLPGGILREEFVAADPNRKKKNLTEVGTASRNDDQEFLEQQKIGEGIATTAELNSDNPKPAPFAMPAPVQRSQLPAPAAPKPVQLPPTPPPLAPKPAPVPKGLPTTQQTHAKGNRVFAIIGLAVVVLVLVGVLYVLALSGARIPVLGSMVSGLEGNVSQVRDRAAAFVTTSGSYQFAGVNEINVTNESDKTLADGTPAVYKLHTETTGGLISEKGTKFISSDTVAANDGTAGPVLLRDTGAGLLTAFPANLDTSVTSLTATDLNDTLLAPALRPLPLEVVLKAVQAERSYQKVQIAQKPAASYAVNLDATALASYFPKGATLESPIAAIAFAWKGSGETAAEPLDVQTTLAFTYQSRKYTYAAHWTYSGWGATSATPAELTVLASADPANTDTTLTAESFISRLGLAFKALPHGTDATSGEPANVSTTFTPVIPSGDVITVVQTARDANPPVPVQPASAEAKARDTQRKQDILDIQKAIEEYKTEKGTYPFATTELQLGSNAALFSSLVPTYLSKMPVDPLNSTYFYAYNVVTDLSGTVTGYYIRSILEDASDPSATVGQVYTYYELKK